MRKGRIRWSVLFLAVALALVSAYGFAEDAQRPEKQAITIVREGESEAFPFKLHKAADYSLYIPENDWEYRQGRYFGAPWEQWVSQYNDFVTMTIITFPETTIEEARHQLQLASSDYELIEDKRGGLGGLKDNWLLMDAAFYENPQDKTVFAVILQHPLEASEGFGVILRAASQTFMFEK